MVREIVRDVIFLSRKSEPATKEDAGVVADLKDTLAAHRDGCVGMAANMIGVSKRIIIFTGDDGDVVMINPVISAKMGRYETQEGCLSLDGERMAVRFEKIEVRYPGQQNDHFRGADGAGLLLRAQGQVLGVHGADNPARMRPS